MCILCFVCNWMFCVSSGRDKSGGVGYAGNTEDGGGNWLWTENVDYCDLLGNSFYFCLFDCVLIAFAVWLDVCFSSSNVCVLMHDSQQQIEMLMKSMAHVAQQEVMCRQITSARVVLAAERDSWYSHQTMVWTICGWISGSDKRCFFSALDQTFSKAYPSSFIFSGYQGFFLQALMVTTHSHLVPG